MSSFVEKAQSVCPTILGEGSLRVGCDVRPGWEEIVLDALIQIERIAQDHLPGLRVDQVKEKFGLLRIYMSEHDERVEAIIGAAALASGRTCDTCGQPGTTGPKKIPGRAWGGWIRTLCEQHRSVP